MEFNAISLSRFIMRRAIDTINDDVHSENRCNIEVKRSTFLKYKGRRERENILCANNLSIYLIYATEIIRNSRMLFSEWLSTNIRLVQGNSQFTYDNLVVPNHFPSVICWWCSMHIWEGQYMDHMESIFRLLVSIMSSVGQLALGDFALGMNHTGVHTWWPVVRSACRAEI